jgi:hypothetical protein
MTVDPRLVTVVPYQAKRVVADRLDVVETEVAAFHERDGTLVTLAVCAGAVAAKKLVRVDASVSVGPVDFHDAGAARGTKLERFRGLVVHCVRPSHRPEAAPVRCRTPTVACWPSSWSSAS